MNFFNRKNSQVKETQDIDAEIQDLENASKRSRWFHIGFGIASLCLLGLLALSLSAFGGIAALTTAFYAVNLTLSITVLGCLAGAVISKIFNRKNNAKLKILREAKISQNHMKNSKVLDDKAIQKNKRNLLKHYDRGSKFLSEAQKEYIQKMVNEGVDNTKQPQVEEKEVNWRQKENISLKEAQDVLYNYEVPQKKVVDEFNTTKMDATIESVVLYPQTGRPIVIMDLIKAENDVSFDVANLDLMQLANKTEGLAKIKVVKKVNGEETTEEREPNSESKFYTNEEIEALKINIDSKKAPTL